MRTAASTILEEEAKQSREQKVQRNRLILFVDRTGFSSQITHGEAIGRISPQESHFVLARAKCAYDSAMFGYT